MNDTICAIATSQGVGAIAIIRVSGEEAVDIVAKIFKGKDLRTVDSHTINYGNIVDKSGNIFYYVYIIPKLFPGKYFSAKKKNNLNYSSSVSTYLITMCLFGSSPSLVVEMFLNFVSTL